MPLSHFVMRTVHLEKKMANTEQGRLKRVSKCEVEIASRKISIHYHFLIFYSRLCHIIPEFDDLVNVVAAITEIA